MNKKYQIFISSTYEDLKEERIKVRDAILSMYHFPVGMELFGAADEEQWEIIKETIDTSDYYILIIGQRYGSVIQDGTDNGISYTEKEFLYAKKQNIPILAFLIDDSVILPAEKIEKKHRKEFELFKSSVMTGRTIDRWRTPDELAQKVTAALYKQIGRKPRPGWIRGDIIDIEKSLNEIVELNKRNRKLEEENKRIKTSISTRKPVLAISIRQYGTRETPKPVGEELGSILFKEIKRDGYMALPEKLSMDDLHGKPGASSYDIMQYNENLPTKEQIKNYNDDVYAFRMMVENGYHIKIELANKGTIKAMNASARLIFPEEFAVYQWRDIEGKDPPKKPPIPVNPLITNDIKQTIGSLAGFVDITGKVRERTAEYYGEGKYPVHIKSMIPYLDYSFTVSQSVEQTTAEVSARELLHKSSGVIGDFCIIPKTKGVFTISVLLMCEEYTEPDIGIISLQVE